MARKRDFYHTGLDVSRSECKYSRKWQRGNPFGDEYYVYGTDGKDGDDGTLDYPVKTIQEALTRQIANNSGKGDTIWVMPGTYAESITGDLTGVEVLGAGLTPYDAIIAPVNGHGYSGNLTNARIANMTFRNASTLLPNYATIRTTQMIESYIEDNIFQAISHQPYATGIRIGLEAGGDTTTLMYRSKISRNHFQADGASKHFSVAVCMGQTPKANQDGYAARHMWNSYIEDNHMGVEAYGIKLHCHHYSGYGCHIRGNLISGDATSHGATGEEGIHFYSQGLLNHGIWVTDNKVSSKLNAINGFQVQQVMNNLVAIGVGGANAPALEYAHAT